jgi:hypothetical protein
MIIQVSDILQAFRSFLQPIFILFEVAIVERLLITIFWPFSFDMSITKRGWYDTTETILLVI